MDGEAKPPGTGSRRPLDGSWGWPRPGTEATYYHPQKSAQNPSNQLSVNPGVAVNTSLHPTPTLSMADTGQD